MAIIEASNGNAPWLACNFLRVAAVLAAALCGACSTWLDREMIEREVPVQWVEAASSTETPDGQELRFTVSTTAQFRLIGGEIRHTTEVEEAQQLTQNWWIGYIGTGGREAVRTASSQIVLQSGDDVYFRWIGEKGPAPELILQRQDNLQLEVAEQSSEPPQVKFEEDNGHWSVVVSKAGKARVSAMVEDVERAPLAYTIGGGTSTAEELDQAETLQWILFPPVGLGRLLSRLLGSRLEEPSDYSESVLGVHFVSTDKQPPCQLAVTGRELRWQLNLPEARQPVPEANVQTKSSGRARFDFHDYLERIAEDLDHGSIGRLVVTDVESGQKLEQAVNLQRIRDAARARPKKQPADKGEAEPLDKKHLSR